VPSDGCSMGLERLGWLWTPKNSCSGCSGESHGIVLPYVDVGSDMFELEVSCCSKLQRLGCSVRQCNMSSGLGETVPAALKALGALVPGLLVEKAEHYLKYCVCDHQSFVAFDSPQLGDAQSRRRSGLDAFGDHEALPDVEEPRFGAMASDRSVEVWMDIRRCLSRMNRHLQPLMSELLVDAIAVGA
jgi:hypothetical protein